MSNREKKGPPAEVGELLRQITAWRNRRTKGEPIPEEFWSEATKLGRAYGVSLISRHLKLDFHGLKRRVLARPKPFVAKGSGFVELRCMDVPGISTPVGSFVTEMEICKGKEVTVRVRQSGPSGIDMVGMMEWCMGRE